MSNEGIGAVIVVVTGVTFWGLVWYAAESFLTN